MPYKRKNKPAKGKVPLERALSKLGIASRTQSREWIRAGKVRVNGVVRQDPLFAVTPETVRIDISGQAIEKAKPLTLMLHKPRGVVTTRSDEKGRPTVFSLLKGYTEHLSPVGRLDLATTGLLLLTNNTRLAAWLTDPQNKIPRVYVVTVRGLVTEEEIEAMKKGVVDAGEALMADQVQLRKASRRESHLTVELTEGKNREIRRLFLAVGHEVTRLKRVAFGGLTLGSLQPGQYRVVSDEELRQLFPRALPLHF